MHNAGWKKKTIKVYLSVDILNINVGKNWDYCI